MITRTFKNPECTVEVQTLRISRKRSDCQLAVPPIEIQRVRSSIVNVGFYSANFDEACADEELSLTICKLSGNRLTYKNVRRQSLSNW